MALLKLSIPIDSTWFAFAHIFLSVLAFILVIYVVDAITSSITKGTTRPVRNRQRRLSRVCAWRTIVILVPQ